MGGGCERRVLEEGVRGGVRGGCGRRMWEEGVRGGCERRVWEEDVGGGCGRRMWEEGVEDYNIKLATNYKGFGGEGGHCFQI